MTAKIKWTAGPINEQTNSINVKPMTRQLLGTDEKSCQMNLNAKFSWLQLLNPSLPSLGFWMENRNSIRDSGSSINLIILMNTIKNRNAFWSTPRISMKLVFKIESDMKTNISHDFPFSPQTFHFINYYLKDRHQHLSPFSSHSKSLIIQTGVGNKSWEEESLNAVESLL